VHKAIDKGLVIIPVRVEKPGRRDVEIAHDTDSMWPDAMIEKYARSETKNETAYWTHLKNNQLQRYAVKEALVNLNTFSPRRSLFGYSTGLQNLVSRVERVPYTLHLKLLAGRSVFICAMHIKLLKKRKSVVSLARSLCIVVYSIGHFLRRHELLTLTMMTGCQVKFLVTRQFHLPAFNP
jgi:hypothetical protein